MALAKEPKAEYITLADGETYKIPPLNLNTLVGIEEIMGFGISNLQEHMEKQQATTLRLLLYALLHESYPELSIENVGELVTLDTLPRITELFTKVLTI